MTLLLTNGGLWLPGGSIPVTGLPAQAGDLPVTSGLVAHFRTDAGLEADAGGVTSFTDQVGGVVATPAGVQPGTVSLQSSQHAIALSISGSAEGMVGTPTEVWPIGTEARTMIVAIKKLAGPAFYQGFGYGSDATNQAFTFGWDEVGHVIADFFANRIIGPTIENEWVIGAMTYDGTDVDLILLNDDYADSTTIALNTGTERVNIAISFPYTGFPNGESLACHWGEALLYSRVLSAGEISDVFDYLYNKIAIDLLAPVITDVSVPTFGVTTAQGQFTIDEAGTAYWGLKTSNVTPSKVELAAGTGLAAFGTVAPTGPSVGFPFSATGLSGNTQYWPFAFAEDAANNEGTVVGGSSFTTAAADVTPPTISITNVTPTTTSVTVDWTTNEGNGTRYYLVSTNASETASTVKTTGSSATVTATGAQSFLAAGLTDATAYFVHIVHRDAAGNDSTVASQSFTTAEDTDDFPAADATVGTWAALQSLLASWSGTTNWNNTAAGLGKSTSDQRYIDLSTNNYGSPSLVGYTFPQWVNIRSANRVALGAKVHNLTLTSLTRVRLQFINLDRNGLGRTTGNGINIRLCQHLEIEYCNVLADFTYGSSTPQPAVNASAGNFGINYDFDGTNRFIAIRYCVIGNKWVKGINGGSPRDFEIREVVFYRQSGDDIFWSGTATDFSVIDCWGSRERWQNDGSGGVDHADFIQYNRGPGTSPTQTRVTIRGNVHMKKLSYTGAYECLIWGQSTSVDAKVEQNFCITNHFWGWALSSNTTGTNTLIRNNTALHVGNQTSPGNQTAVSAGATSINASSGKNIHVGLSSNPPGTGSINLSNASSFAAQLTYYTGHNLGISYFDARPVVASGAHWTDANPLGPAVRFNEVINGGANCPIRRPGPTGPIWILAYDPDEEITP